VTQLAHGPAVVPAVVLAYLPPAAPGQPRALAGAVVTVDAPLTPDKVLAALTLLKDGRSLGASGLPAELLRYALGQEESRGTPAAARAHGCAELLVPRRHRASCLVIPFNRQRCGRAWQLPADCGGGALKCGSMRRC